ncbi:SDR family NAD(P)-dependent oxidoreductase [Streptomyces xiaopingdaonensis]|uniref:SDR family NAD(P)-dependent oxidoreductase n=1 Tax=Streptomyces xiaopingdaonensis TaxID=1565415 RepID=UPI000304BC24|nr:SDR family oxidoreductase [Streptomyces xiaopingdaonensis]
MTLPIPAAEPAAEAPDFAGMAALVTGGGSGIGAATARLLLARGAEVAVLDAEPGGAPPGALALEADVTDEGAVRRAVDRAAAEFGGLHTVVGNAGVGAVGTVEENDDEEWRRVLDVNLLGLVRTDRAALPHLRRCAADRPGRVSITHTCSIAATAGLPQRALYAASKGAVLSLTLAMAADHVREGVRVNCVNPGTADTPWVGRLLGRAADPAAERAALEARQPTGRLVRAAEVARAVAYLAGPDAASVTGESLAVDGGMQGVRLRPDAPGGSAAK